MQNKSKFGHILNLQITTTSAIVHEEIFLEEKKKVEVEVVTLKSGVRTQLFSTDRPGFFEIRPRPYVRSLGSEVQEWEVRRKAVQTGPWATVAVELCY
jgi:hypothetical protein